MYQRRWEDLRQDALLKLIAVIAVIVGVFFAFVSPLANSIRQGLDLQGGTHVVLEAVDTPEAQVNDDAMNRVIAIMEKRVNALGLTEPIIQREGERRVIIELPGVKDPDAAIKTIGKTAMLEFRDEDGNTVLTGTDLKDAQASTNPQTGQNVVNLEFSDEGAQKFADLTMKNVGRTIAILLDGEVLTAPNVREPILGGRAEITQVGDRYVLENMREHGYRLGGEQSGHIIFSDFSTTGDGLITALQVLAALKRTGRKASELSALMKSYPQLLVNVVVASKEGWEENEAIAAAIRAGEEELGGDGRILVRPSGTEPLIRVMAEGPDQAQLEAICHRIANVIKEEQG